MYAAAAEPSYDIDYDQADEAHGKLIVSSVQLADLCQEELTDTGLARIVRLVEQVQQDLAKTIKARATQMT